MERIVETPESLEVRLYGETVGSLIRVPGRRVLFSFDPGYAANPTRPILSLGFLDVARRLREPKLSLPGLVPSFFANLLPEDDLRRYVAKRAGIAVNDDFGLLWVVGEDLPGAVTIHDLQGRTSPPVSIGGPAVTPNPAATLRFSLAGVQLKFSAVENARGGLTISVSGKDGDWIAKLPSRHFDRVPENEFAMMQFAGACGIDIPPNRLVDVTAIDGLPAEASSIRGKAFVIKRFDRRPHGVRVHIEDFNQIFRQQPKDKYDNKSFAHIAEAISVNTGSSGVNEFIERLVFSVAIANSDMHLKNWSVIYSDPIACSLSPAYDFLCTKPYTKHNETSLAIGSAREFNQVSSDQFVQLAKRANLSPRATLRSAYKMVERIYDLWPSYRNIVPDFVASIIDDQLLQVPMLRETFKTSISRYSSGVADAHEQEPNT